MSAMALDQSLDSLIKAKRTARRTSRKSGTETAATKKKVSSTSAAKKAAIVGKKKPAAAPTAPVGAIAPTSNKINLSNLPPDVKENEVRELFAKTVGPLREVTLHYDAKGHSKGMGYVVFSNKEDASKAVQMYHNRLIDGHRQMKVEMVLQPGQAPAPPTLSQRVAPAAKAPAAAAPKKAAAKPVVAKKRQALRRKAPKKSKPAPVTAADLDAQMEDYTAAGVSATAPAS